MWRVGGELQSPDGAKLTFLLMDDDPAQRVKGTDPQLQRAIQEVTGHMRALPPLPARPPQEKRVPGSERP